MLIPRDKYYTKTIYYIDLKILIIKTHLNYYQTEKIKETS
jgi:hypothetical protein